MDRNFQQLKEELSDAIIKGKEELAVQLVEKALDRNIDPIDIFEGCVAPALYTLGERFERLECFLPEMMIGAKIAQKIREVIAPYMEQKAKEVGKKGTIVLGTAKGDIHEIGKNMVSLMLQVNGYEVHDLGLDVSTKAFLEKARSVNADIIGVSALLTTTMPYMRDLIDILREKGDLEKYKVIVGGGPVTPEFAESIGSDGYGKDAVEAVQLCNSLMKQK